MQSHLPVVGLVKSDLFVPEAKLEVRVRFLVSYQVIHAGISLGRAISANIDG